MQSFENRWESNRRYIYGLLISTVKDIDLADDLIQDVYIRASEKIGTYRGGDFRAWLAAIAKNIAYARLRRTYIKAETLLSLDYDDAVQEGMGTDSHIKAMLVRKAVENLSPILRETIILKHYGGFNYPEIAARLGCPVGTAKRRVWTAIRQLRSALGTISEDIPMKKCAEINYLDYAYGILSDDARNTIDAHLTNCDKCKKHLDDIRQVINYLDTVRDQIVFVDITDINEDGSSTTYSSFRITNNSDKPMHTYSFDSMKYHRFLSNIVDCEDASFTIDESGDKYNHYIVQLKRPLTPGDSVTQLGIFTTPEGIGASFDIGYGRRIAVPDNSGDDSSEYMLVQMVRLPEGAKLIGSVPATDEVREGCRTTLVWRRLIPAGEFRERPVVVYSI